MPRTKQPPAPTSSNGQNEAVPAPPSSRISTPEIVIPGLQIARVSIEVVGMSSLICHAFPDKEKARMRHTRQTDESTQPKNKGKSRKVREVRDFNAEYLASMYPIEGGKYGFPAIAFKRSIVAACRQISNLEMTMANRIIFVNGPHQSKGFDCVEIIGKPRMREDIVRLAGIDKPPDIRYRAEFMPWKAVLDIEFNRLMISIEGIYNLVKYAGWSEGVGEQRPSAPKKSGNNGRFDIANTSKGR
jgi:hypothetical protein